MGADRYEQTAEMVGIVLTRPKLVEDIEPVEGNEKISSWVRENPKQFASILKSFDGLIASWNTTNFNPEVNKCASKLKESLDGRSLSLLLPDNPSISDLRNLFETIKRLSSGMIMGQAEEPRGVAYKFHKLGSPQDVALVIGALFHAYETKVGVDDPELDQSIMRESNQPKNHILDALVEHVLTLEPTDLIFQAVTGGNQRGGLDWVDGYSEFSKILQQEFEKKIAPVGSDLVS